MTSSPATETGLFLTQPNEERRRVAPERSSLGSRRRQLLPRKWPTRSRGTTKRWFVDIINKRFGCRHTNWMPKGTHLGIVPRILELSSGLRTRSRARYVLGGGEALLGRDIVY